MTNEQGGFGAPDQPQPGASWPPPAAQPYGAPPPAA